MKPRTNRSDHERGQSMVELVLSFVVLLILLSGVIDLGRAFFAFIALRDAAQEGALYGSIYPLDTDGNFNSGGIIYRVQESSNAPVNIKTLSDNGDIAITPTLIGPVACHGYGIRVEVVWTNFPLVFPFWATFFGGTSTIPLTARVEDTILRPPCK